MDKPRRGDIWLADLDPVRGHEQAGRRPVLVASDDRLNASPAMLVYAVPLTTRNRGIPYHVPVHVRGGSLRDTSYAMCEQMRSLSRERLLELWATADQATMDEIDDRLRVLLDL